MADRTLSFLLITMLVISGIGIGMFNFFDELTTKYSSTLSEPVSESDKNIMRNVQYTENVTRGITDPMSNQLKSTADKGILSNIVDQFIGSVVTSVLLIINIPFIVYGFFSLLMSPLYLILPAWASTMVTAIISLVVVLWIIKIIMKWEI
jgi:hypothetical protein